MASKREFNEDPVLRLLRRDYIGRNVAIDTNGKPVGYGYAGSANNQNRAINEFTFGFNQTMWASPRYGAINVMGQYE